MLFQRPDHDTLYKALCDRDPSYTGQVYVAVQSTGIFCRLTCPARKPKSENCTFMDSVGACLEAGFRACKQCKPLGEEAQLDPGVADLLAALEADPDHRWSEANIIARGHDPSTISRAFKRVYGMTFLEMARMRRLSDGFTALKDGEQVISAQLEAGFESASGFREAFARMLGLSPGQFRGDELLKADWIDTPLGAMIAVCDQHVLHLLEFIDRKALPAELGRLLKSAKGGIGIGRTPVTDRVEEELNAFFAGQSAHFTTPLALHGSEFTREVWQALRDIPAGETRSYGELAKALGRPGSSRAVARANGANQIALIIPCHRVIGADGSLTGYGGGLWRKEKLIALERAYAQSAAE
ncbi:MAG: bifunctional transcriptional activator/DNA repair protein Ada [Alphaproteobacteria bacterium]|nr:bifunctional transcriptional activator/DNA repair protein Ada [Alphaproteobacteria bacterium]